MLGTVHQCRNGRLSLSVAGREAGRGLSCLRGSYKQTATMENSFIQRSVCSTPTISLSAIPLLKGKDVSTNQMSTQRYLSNSVRNHHKNVYTTTKNQAQTKGPPPTKLINKRNSQEKLPGIQSRVWRKLLEKCQTGSRKKSKENKQWQWQQNKAGARGRAKRRGSTLWFLLLTVNHGLIFNWKSHNKMVCRLEFPSCPKRSEETLHCPALDVTHSFSVSVLYALPALSPSSLGDHLNSEGIGALAFKWPIFHLIMALTLRMVILLNRKCQSKPRSKSCGLNKRNFKFTWYGC